MRSASWPVRGFVKRLNRERGVTVILTTHDMDDIEALVQPDHRHCKNGKILSDGSPTSSARVSPRRWLTVDLADDQDGEIFDDEATIIRREGNRICLSFDPQQVSPATLIGRITARIRCTTCSSRIRRSKRSSRGCMKRRLDDRRALRPYLAVVKVRFRMMLQYRAGGRRGPDDAGLLRVRGAS